jgi:hypothetical protein
LGIAGNGATEGSEVTKIPFHNRFQINVDLKETHRRFVNRVTNQIFDGLYQHDIKEEIVRGRVLWEVANDFGEEYDWNNWFDDYVKHNYEKCLHALEAAYVGLKSKKHRAELSR